MDSSRGIMSGTMDRFKQVHLTYPSSSLYCSHSLIPFIFSFTDVWFDYLLQVFEKKSNKRICKLAGYFVLAFFVLYYLMK